MSRIPGKIHHNNRENPLPNTFRSLQQIKNQSRPQTSTHRQYYFSKGYRLTSEERQKKKYSTIQIKDEIYFINKNESVSRKPSNAYSFLKSCEDETKK